MWMTRSPNLRDQGTNKRSTRYNVLQLVPYLEKVRLNGRKDIVRRFLESSAIAIIELNLKILFRPVLMISKSLFHVTRNQKFLGRFKNFVAWKNAS